MGVIVLGSVLLAGLVMIAAGKMSDTTFGIWIGGMTVDAFGYGASNLLATKLYNGKAKKK